MEARVSVLLFDVDKTLTAVHVSHKIAQLLPQHKTLTDAVRALPPNRELVSESILIQSSFASLVHFCARNHIRIALGSFGHHAYIDTLVKDLERWLPDIANVWLRCSTSANHPVVLTPRDFDAREGTDALKTKNRMVERVASLAGVSVGNVMLIDDSSTNTFHARLLGAFVFQVRGNNGLTAHQCKVLEERLERNLLCSC